MDRTLSPSINVRSRTGQLDKSERASRLSIISQQANEEMSHLMQAGLNGEANNMAEEAMTLEVALSELKQRNACRGLSAIEAGMQKSKIEQKRTVACV